MKESNTLAGNATIKQLQKEVLLNIKRQYMKESNTHVYNAEKNLLLIQIWLNTKGKYMKKSNTFVCNVTINHPLRQILPDTTGQYMREEGTEKSRLMYDCGAHPAYGRHHLKKLRNLDMTQIMNLTPSKIQLLHLLVPPSSNIFSMWCQYFGDKILIVTRLGL